LRSWLSRQIAPVSILGFFMLCKLYNLVKDWLGTSLRAFLAGGVTIQAQHEQASD
jgi:hypothetical protein